ncbi:MAG TPA: hypothetical protein VEK07_07925 [Polyangiaceae bacterium]|nr:hypothetical protein [Polyangiaceae bacterium]
MRRARKRIATTAAVLVAGVGGLHTCPLAWAQADEAGDGAPSTISWSGFEWNVKSVTDVNPGPNDWSAANVFVDGNGDLHLAITNVGGTWYCAEVWTNVAFGFGTFQWQVETAVDQFDPNVVLGLFVYGPPALGPDGTHEFDIEYARFGSATGDNGWWTVFPNVEVTPPLLGQSDYSLSLGANPATTSRFTWSSTNVAFATMAGFQPPGASTDLLDSWTYEPADPSEAISQSPMPVHMNLWLYNGDPPTNGQGAEVVIQSFSFTPSLPSGSTMVPALPSNRPLLLAACLMGVGLFGSGAAIRSRAPRAARRRHPSSQ